MKFAENTATVEGNAVFEVTKKMEVENASISRIIRSLTDMYSDPLLAIAREYISNAYDATIARMGVQSSFSTVLDIPIEVTLPSSLNPNFTVRDYGTGMDQNVLMNVFPKYGASSKRDNNNEIGGFGLGAKSALAVVANFSVTTVKDGKKNIAIIQKGVDGVGEISLLPEEDTDEHSGTIVNIVFSSEKADELQSIFAKPHLLMGFPNGSITVNGKMHEESLYNTEKYLKVGDKGWISKTLFTDKHVISFGWNARGAVIGPISYAIPSKYVDGIRNNWKMAVIQNSVLNLPIGIVDFTPARENLIFSSRTIDAIHTTKNGFLEEAEALIMEYVENCDSEKSAARMVRSLRLRGVDLPFTFKGELVPTTTLASLIEDDKEEPENERKSRWIASNHVNRGRLSSLYKHAHGFSIKDVVLVTDAPKTAEELVILNGYRKFFASSHYKNFSGDLPVVFIEDSESEVSKWVKNCALDSMTAEKWAEQGAVYEEADKEKKREQARAKRAMNRKISIANPATTTLTVIHPSRNHQRPTLASFPVSSLKKDSTVIYIQNNKEETGTVSHAFAALMSGKSEKVSHKDLNSFLRACASYYSKGDKPFVGVVRVSASMKIENFLKTVPNAISADEAMAAIAADSLLKVENDEKALLTENLLTNHSLTKFEWIYRISEAELDGIEREDVRKFYKLVSEIATTQRYRESDTMWLAESPRFDMFFGSYSKKVKEAFLYPAPLLSKLGRYSDLNAKDVIEYINLLHPVSK